MTSIFKVLNHSCQLPMTLDENCGIKFHKTLWKKIPQFHKIFERVPSATENLNIRAGDKIFPSFKELKNIREVINNKLV